MSNQLYIEEPEAGEFRPRRRKKRRHPVRTTVLVLLGLVLAAAAMAGGYVWNLANTFNSKTETIASAFPDEADRPAKSDGSMNILLLGSDVRGGSGETENLNGVPNGGRSDTMMLMHIPSNRQNVYVMSIMRDTWTDIPGYGEHKINSAMAFGGVPLLVQTLEGLFDTRVDHVAIIDFAGFKNLTDALGGVEINNPTAFSAVGQDGVYFPQGVQTLNGEQALKFVRERKAFSDGDYQRVKNQQLFVKAVMARFLNAETLTNPARINGAVSEFAPYLSVDSGLDAATVGSLGVGLRDIRNDDIHFFTLPNQGIGTSADGQSIILKDQAAIDAIAAAMKADQFDDYWASAEAGS
ncbi:LCP family protein [Arthrobacter sp. GCM10027362]|uniref:LCP family protein n=1 Tax=Arthrobacter sp. GCM10027362 TaxID=3273379 RepID=UPI00363E6143